MKKILLIIGSIILISWGMGELVNYGSKDNSYGKWLNRILPDSALHLPEKDTLLLNDANTTSQIFLNKKDSAVWYWYAGQYYILKGGNSVDIDSINNALNARVLIANLPTILNPYVLFDSLNSYVTQLGFLTGPIANGQLQHSSIFFFSSTLLLSGSGTATLGNNFTINADTSKLVTITALRDSLSHASGFWAEIGTQIHNTNLGNVNIFTSYFDSLGGFRVGNDSAEIYTTGKNVTLSSAQSITYITPVETWAPRGYSDGVMYLSAYAAAGIQWGVGGAMDGNGTQITLNDTALTIKLQATKGVYLNADRYPLTDGTSGQVATTNGAGIVSWQSATGGITALTGDGTASGTGSVAFTLATVNSNVGTFGSASAVPSFTVNAKGLITAVTSTNILITESQVTSLVSDLANKQPLENQRLSTSDNVVFNTLNLLTQSSAPSTPSSGLTVYANSNNALSWIKSDGFTRALVIPYGGNVTLRAETKASYTLADSADVAASILAPSNTIKQYLNGFKQFVTLNTDSIPVGSTNLYFTQTLARNSVSIAITRLAGTPTYTSSTGIFDIPQVDTVATLESKYAASQLTISGVKVGNNLFSLTKATTNSGIILSTYRGDTARTIAVDSSLYVTMTFANTLGGSYVPLNGSAALTGNWNIGAHVITATNNMALGVTGDAFDLFNNTAATGSASGYSPSVHFKSFGWKSNATAVSQNVDVINYLQGVSGGSAASFNMIWADSIAAAGSYTTFMRYADAAGLLQLMKSGSGFQLSNGADWIAASNASTLNTIQTFNVSGNAGTIMTLANNATNTNDFLLYPMVVSIAGITAASGAEFTVTSSTQGVSFSTLTQTAWNSIASPATNLLAYISNVNAFEYFNGTTTKTLMQSDTLTKSNGMIPIWNNTNNAYTPSLLIGGIGISISNSAGSVTISESMAFNKTISTPTTGSTVNLVLKQDNIINPSGALVALTVNLPSSPNNGDALILTFEQAITTVTYTGGTVAGAITGPIAGSQKIWVFDSGTSTWY